MKDNKSIYIEGLSPQNHRWESENKYLNEYDHPLWKRFSSSKGDLSQAGHGGMDFFIARAFIESIKGAKVDKTNNFFYKIIKKNRNAK